MNIVVTGAAGGIGRLLVARLVEAGHQITATDVSIEALRNAAADLAWPEQRVQSLAHDVTSGAAWQSLLEHAEQHWGGVDVLVNLAGVLRVESVCELTAEAVALQLDVNTRGVILGTQAAASRMVRRGRGHVINVASMAALAPVPGIAVYSASKYAVRGFSLAAAQELEPQGVHVTVVCPDAVATPMVDYQLDYPAAALTFSGSRVLSADEVARAIVRLLVKRPPLELAIPRSRGWLARVSNLFPRGLHRRISARLVAKGLQRQQSLRQRRPEH